MSQTIVGLNGITNETLFQLTVGTTTYTFPTSDGVSTNILQTNGDGLLSFVTKPTSGSGFTRKEIVSGSSTNYQILSSDEFLGISYTQTSSGTLTLPDPTDGSNQSKRFTVIDESGNASVNNINIQPFASESIIGNTSLIINGDYNSVNLYTNGTDWFIA